MYLVCAINLPGKPPLAGPWQADRWHEKLSTINVFVAIRSETGRCFFKGTSLAATVRWGGQVRMEVATVGSSHAHSDCQPVPHDVQEELQKGKF